jgi:hypothetical protein
MKECGEGTVRPIVHCQKLDNKVIVQQILYCPVNEEDSYFPPCLKKKNYTQTVVF